MQAWITEFIVEGRGEFPFDMLRYDGCYPYGQHDVHRMYTNPAISSQSREVRRVALQKIHNGRPTPTNVVATERWNSFDWVVFNIESRKM